MPSPEATAVVPLEVPPSIRLISVAVEVTPSMMFNSAAVAVPSVPPSFNPLDVSCEATSKSIAPSEIVTSLSSLMDIEGVVPTAEPSPMTRSSAESSRPT